MSVDVTPVADDCWMSVADVQLLEKYIRRINFDVVQIGYQGPTYWEGLWTPTVKKFCRIVVPNVLELANINELCMNPLAAKKFGIFQSKISIF